MTSRLCLDLNGVVIDTSAALLALSREISGLSISAATFAGKETVGREFALLAELGRAEFQPEHYEEAKRRFFEDRRDFFRCAMPVRGVVRAAQILAAHGWSIAIVSDAKRLQETHLNEWLHRHKFPTCEKILTRGNEPKEIYQKCCDVVVDNEIGQLLPLRSQNGLRLVHFLPEEGEVGCDADRPTSVDPEIMPVRGWFEALPYVRQFQSQAA